VWSSPAGEVVVVGIRALLRSSDEGRNWRASADPGVTRSWYQAIGVAEQGSTVGLNGRVSAEQVFVGGQRATVSRVTR